MIDTIILVHYLNKQDLNAQQFSELVSDCKQRLQENSNLKDAFCYFVPTDGENRVECINPKLVGEKDYQTAKEALDKCTAFLEELTAKNAKIT